MSSEQPQSPCVSVCVLDENDICMGCYRSAEEVTDWYLASDQQKWEILTRARERRLASTSIVLD